ncbi:MAG: hypothetical protein JOY94_20980 [Methylobacteriaceae bacterium]|nr:hypothetical protein [Methylobacteriaceae bacterium]
MQEAQSASDAERLAIMLRDIVDTMIPGEDGWPAASLVGVQGILGMRLLESLGENCLADLESELAACGGPLGPLAEAERLAVLERLEHARPKLFALVRTAACLAYYESPTVVRQIQTLGQPYKAIPGIEGYPTVPFDLERDRPRHNRGHYIATDGVRRVDLSALSQAGGANGPA